MIRFSRREDCIKAQGWIISVLESKGIHHYFVGWSRVHAIKEDFVLTIQLRRVTEGI